jgi:uncharacterized membrane protein
MATQSEDLAHAPARFAIGVTGVGHAMYSAAVAGLGALLFSRQFVYIWAPIPPWVPWGDVLASASGALMLVSAVGLLWRKTVVPSSSILTFLFLSWLLLLHTPQVIAAPSEELLWAGVAEIATLVAGGWVLFASLAFPTEGPRAWLRGGRGVRMARSLYAAALPVLGLHHFLAQGAVEVVPAWLPLRPGWVYLTGVAHMAAGAAILLGIVPRLAAMLEAVMISAFILLVHVPGVIGDPGDQLQWTMFCAASATGGAAWIVAHSYQDPRRAKPL